MKRQLKLICYFLFYSYLSIAQSSNERQVTEFDSIVHNRIYQINVNDYQILELVEYKNGNFSGSLTNYVLLINDKSQKNKLIAQKINIPEKMSIMLMDILKNKKFEIIPDCKNFTDCLQGFDGKTHSFTVMKKNFKHEYSYWEVESNYYYRDDSIPQNVKDIREVLEEIKKFFNMNEQFSNFLKLLPKGSYEFGGVLMEKT